MGNKNHKVGAAERQLLREIQELTSRRFVYEDAWCGMVPFSGKLTELQTGPQLPFAELTWREQADVLREFINWDHPERARNDVYRIRENIEAGKPPEAWLPLVVERLEGLPIISLTHYGTQNGDSMRDPECCFLIAGETAQPIYFRNDYLGVEHATVQGHFGDVPVKPHLQRDLQSFVSMWWTNLREQGFFQRAKELSEQDKAREHERDR